MRLLKSKHIIILLLSVVALSSCRAKKTFNGTATLPCTDFETELKAKKKSKWRLVLYKDGQKIGKKSKKGRSKLFKKNNDN